jgi:hypothetical protein
MTEDRSAAAKTLGVGFALAALVSALPFARFVFSYLIVLIHELGHAACYWLFGYPAVPAFDFVHGGGVTVHQDRSTALLLLSWGLIGGSIWLLRANRLALKVIGGLALAHAALVVTGGDLWIGVAGGHAFELLFAGLFLYRSVTGSGVKHAAERPLYAACGFFLWMQSLALAGRLATSASARGDYRLGKGGALTMDLERLGAELLGSSLSGAAWLLFVATLAVLPLTWLWLRHEDAVLGFLGRLFSRGAAA